MDDGNYGYILRFEGSGEISGFASEKDAPWYSVSGRIKGIEFPEGVTAIGDNLFSRCVYLESVVLPKSVRRIGKSSFSSKTAVCSYSAISAPEGQNVYIYAEEKPSDGGLYWHLSGGEVIMWDLTKVLFIGNSFTYYNDMEKIFNDLASKAGLNVSAQRVSAGAYTLEKLADPNDKVGAIVHETLNGTDDFDVIVLQEQSTRPITNVDKFSDGVQSLVSLISKTQKNCRIYLYETWGFPAGATIVGLDVPQMEAKLYESYTTVANELDLTVCPVGKAFLKVYTEHPEIELYNPDGRHPSPEGSFLAACVHAAEILGIDPKGLELDGFKSQDVLASAAYDVVNK
ncbi:MAG: leucine-rich repeat protein [Spirochaetales bacterium]|nr:leucine-rich repeat protein [Spirochaetales bacterium]